jgi:hypothetical protein
MGVFFFPPEEIEEPVKERYLDSCETLLLIDFVTTFVQVENKVLKGPENDLGGFLVAVDQLQNNVEFFTLNSSLKASNGALSHAKGLLTKGMTRLTEEFKALLVQHRFTQNPFNTRLCDAQSFHDGSFHHLVVLAFVCRYDLSISFVHLKGEQIFFF